MKEHTITFIRKENKTSAAGKPYESVSLKVQEYGDRYLSGFGSVITKDWKVGDKVMIEVKEAEKKDKNGRPYLNFEYEKKKPQGISEQKFDQIITGQQLILGKLNELGVAILGLNPEAIKNQAERDAAKNIPF